MMKTFMKTPKRCFGIFFLEKFDEWNHDFCFFNKGTFTHGCHVFLANFGACFGEMRLVAWALQDAQSIAGSIIPAVVRG